MKNKSIIILLVALIYQTAFSQDLASISKAVGLLTYINRKNNTIEYGTGSLIVRTIDSTHAHIYLVTNKHVLPDKNVSRTIDFRIKKEVGNVNSYVTIKVPIYD